MKKIKLNVAKLQLGKKEITALQSTQSAAIVGGASITNCPSMLYPSVCNKCESANCPSLVGCASQPC